MDLDFHDGRAAYTALPYTTDWRFAVMHYTRRSRLTATGTRVDTVLRSRPSGLPNTVAAVGMHIFLAGTMGQSHLRRRLHPCSSPHWYCVLAGTYGLAVTTTSTTICSIRYACLISTPRRRRWTWREEAWAGHASRVRLWRNLGERSVVFSVVRPGSLTEVNRAGGGNVGSSPTPGIGFQAATH